MGWDTCKSPPRIPASGLARLTLDGELLLLGLILLSRRRSRLPLATALGRRRLRHVASLALARLPSTGIVAIVGLNIGIATEGFELSDTVAPVRCGSVGILKIGHLGKLLEVGLRDRNVLVLQPMLDMPKMAFSKCGRSEGELYDVRHLLTLTLFSTIVIIALTVSSSWRGVRPKLGPSMEAPGILID